MRLLTIILVLFSLSVQAQMTTVGGKVFRRIGGSDMPSRNFGADTVKTYVVIDSSRASGYLILSKDTTSMYTYADTMNMYTTAKAWKFTPQLPCCVPDTIDLNFITTQCTTVTSNRWRPVLTDSLGRASTTACDTISYLYVDTIRYGVDMSGLYIPLAGTDSLNPVVGDIRYAKDYDHWAMEYIDPNNSDNKLGVYFDDGNMYIRMDSANRFQSITFGGSLSGFTIATSILDSLPNYFGIQGQDYYGSNYTPNAYVQKKYVDDNFTPNSSILTDTATLDFASIPAQLFEDITVTVTGASVGDVVSIGIPTAAAVPSSMFTAFVSATDTVTIRAANISLISIDPASGLFKVKVFKD